MGLRRGAVVAFVLIAVGCSSSETSGERTGGEQPAPAPADATPSNRLARSDKAPPPTKLTPKMPDDFEFAQAAGTGSVDTVRLLVTEDSIFVGDSRITAIMDGFIVGEKDARNVVPLFERLLEDAEKAKSEAAVLGHEWEARLPLAVDARTKFHTLVSVLVTAGRAGYTGFDFVVRRDADAAPALLPVELPRFTAMAAIPPNDGQPELEPEPQGALDGSPGLSVELTLAGITVARGAESEQPPIKTSAGDYAKISEQARRLDESDPKAHRAAISASEDTTFGHLAGATAAVRGPDCDGGGEGCLLPDVILLSEGAHGFHFVPKPSKEVRGILGVLESRHRHRAHDYGRILGGDDGDRPGPEVSKPAPTVSGPLDASVAARILRAHQNETLYCYELALEKEPNLQGTVVMSFAVGPTGKVASASVKQDTLTNALVGKCIEKKVRRWQFPAYDEGVSKVTWAIEFSPV